MKILLFCSYRSVDKSQYFHNQRHLRDLVFYVSYPWVAMEGWSVAAKLDRFESL